MDECIFCRIVQKKSPAYIVYEGDEHIAFLDKYPRTRGHLQLVPKIHYPRVYDIPKIGEFFILAQKIIHGIIPVLGASHVTLGALGAEIAHAHLWIVPQYGFTREINEGEKNKTGGQEEIAKLLFEALKNI